MTFSPREIVSELDRFIVGQNDAKRAVAIALRNRCAASPAQRGGKHGSGAIRPNSGLAIFRPRNHQHPFLVVRIVVSDRKLEALPDERKLEPRGHMKRIRVLEL